VGEAPGGFIDYARFLFVADGGKARRELGFVPRYSSRDALVAYLQYRYPETVRSGRAGRPGQEAEGQEAEGQEAPA
jgi:hypothetical protein